MYLPSLERRSAGLTPACHRLALYAKTSENFPLLGETLARPFLKTLTLVVVVSLVLRRWVIATGPRPADVVLVPVEPSGSPLRSECLPADRPTDHTCLCAADDPLSSSDAAFTSCGKNHDNRRVPKYSVANRFKEANTSKM